MNKLLYIDCANSGIAGDMFLAALHGLQMDSTLLDDMKTYISEKITSVAITRAELAEVVRNGMKANKLIFEFSETHPEMHVEEIQQRILELCDYLKLSVQAKEYASLCFSILLEAELAVHSSDSSEISHLHLHELGSVDTLIDLCGCSALLDVMGVFSSINTTVRCSIVAVGGGLVKIAHGSVPVPAPATLKIIEKYSIPIHGGPIQKELFTPTGAALLAGLVEKKLLEFESAMPPMIVNKTGQITGTLGDATFPNILRVYVGTTTISLDEKNEEILVLETMVDDSTGETIGEVMNELLAVGAVDVNFISVQGKKNRPGVLIRVITHESNADALISVLFSQLGTLGVRYRTEKRICLKREIIEKKTKIDNVSFTYHIKVAYNPSNPDEILFFKVEHDDLVRISKKIDKPVSIIRAKLESESFKDT